MIIFTGNFYKTVINKLINKNIITLDSSILVVAGGDKDKRFLEEIGFTDVTISNLDERMKADSFKPYKWAFEDAESLTFKDDSFDFVFIHHGLHHCVSPHIGLLELYRVAKKGVLAFEPIDNFITKIGLVLGFSEKFELTAVYDHEFKYGGVRNTNIPNFVYRWTKNEVKKTVQCCNPKSKVKSLFFYGLELPYGRLKRLKNKLFYLISILSTPSLLINFLLFNKNIANRFGFYIAKPEYPGDLYPWLKSEENKIVPDKEYFYKKFKKK